MRVMEGHCFEGAGALGRVNRSIDKSRHTEHARRKEGQFGARSAGTEHFSINVW